MILAFRPRVTPNGALRITEVCLYNSKLQNTIAKLYVKSSTCTEFPDSDIAQMYRILKIPQCGFAMTLLMVLQCNVPLINRVQHPVTKYKAIVENKRCNLLLQISTQSLLAMMSLSALVHYFIIYNVFKRPQKER